MSLSYQTANILLVRSKVRLYRKSANNTLSVQILASAARRHITLQVSWQKNLLSQEKAPRFITHIHDNTEYYLTRKYASYYGNKL